MDRLPAALGIVLVLQTVLDDLELQLTDGADNLAAVELVDEQLGDTLVHQLVDTLLQLLRLHRVVVLDILEQLRRERRQSAEVQLLALGQRVANLEDAVVGQSHDVARPGLVDGRLALRHELRRRGEAQRLALTHMQVGLVALELAAAHLAEGYARAVVGVDVGGNLEDEARELGLVGLHVTLLGLGGLRRRGYLDKAVQQFLHTEVVECRTEEDGSHLGRAVRLHLEVGIDAADQLQVLTQLLGILLAHSLVQLLAVNVHLHFLRHALLVGGKQVELLLVDIIDALELGTLVDGPRQRTDLDFQFLLQLVQQVERVAALTVHLVDEDDDGRIPHAAHRHQLAGLSLHTLRTVYHDDGRVDSRQRAVGILGKVLVTRGVEDVHLILYVRALRSIVELHDRGRDGDATLLLDVHPVAGGGFLNLVVLDGTGHLNLSAKQQELLSQRGLTGIRVRDNRKGSSTFYFLIHIPLYFRHGPEIKVLQCTRPATLPSKEPRCRKSASAWSCQARCSADDEPVSDTHWYATDGHGMW